jgi:hypothetical protein
MKLFSLSLSLLCFASPPARADFLPPNDLAREDNLFRRLGGLSEQQYNDVLSLIEAHYAPIIRQNFGAELVIERNWISPVVNAFAAREGNKWQIFTHGGMPRRAELTEDGYTLVICHELGHHVGGYPFKGESWAASEGQSDYFATKECLRKIWALQVQQNEEKAAAVESIPKQRCDAAWVSNEDRNLCYRIAMAGKSSALLSSVLSKGPPPKFETPDNSQADRTIMVHPKPQCRLDTYLSSATCHQPSMEEWIPGLANPFGKNSKEAEIESAQNSCYAAAPLSDGFRPSCWFKPQATLLVDVQPTRLAGERNDSSPGSQLQANIPLRNVGLTTLQLTQVSINSLNPRLVTTPSDSRSLEIEPLASDSFEAALTIDTNAVCGERLDYEVVLETPSASEHFLRSVRVGRTEKTQSFSRTKQFVFRRGQTTSDKVLADSAATPEVVTVLLDIMVFDSSTIDIQIKSPAGNIYALHNREPGFDILKTYDFLPKSDEIFAGEWELLIHSHNDTLAGIVNKWELNFFDAICVPSSP